METVAIDKEKNLKRYQNGTDAEKKLMEEIFGKSFFKSGNITDYIKTVEDAYNDQWLRREETIPYKQPKSSLEIGINAMTDMLVVSKSLQQDWKADYGNPSQYKYWPYFIYDTKKAGFGFSGASYCYGDSGTTVGSRLCFPNAELAKYFGTQFIDIINQFLNI